MRPSDQQSTLPDGVERRPSWNETLRALREARGATQEGWAARLGVSRKTVQRWESGERAPDPGAEAAILSYCREAGLLRSFDRGPLAGLSLTEESLRDLFGEARWRGAAREATVPAPVGEEQPAPQSPGAATTPPVAMPPSHLPVQLTSFVGREREIAAVRRVQAGTRLLTLAGAGGCGKTRLALAVAGELLWAYPHGVWFIDLAPLPSAGIAGFPQTVDDPADIPQVIADALGVRAVGAQPLMEALGEALWGRHLLLVLDNCEHLLPGCARVAESLLRACPQLEVLATSREPLGIGGEVVWRVPPMSLPSPPAGGCGSDEHAVEPAAADAVRLFIDRVRLQRPEYALSPDDQAAIVEICRRLDGMPLAIELAAARMGVLSVRQIAERLHDRFSLLARRGQAALPRHQTLRATMDWSHDLLTGAERALLRCLCVFAGGFTLEAAERVCGDEAAGSGQPPVLDLLTLLVDKSLIVAEEHGGAVRYRMLETVREFAEQKLHDAREAPSVHERHLSWCLVLAEEAAAAMHGPSEVTWLARLEEEHDNLRTAMGRALAQGGDQQDAALRLAGALPRFWELRGHLSEGRRWLSQVLATASDAPAGARARALRGAGTLAYMQGDLAAAHGFFADNLALVQEIGDERGIAEAQGNLGRALLRQGEMGSARAHLDASLARFTELDHKPGIANVHFTLGVISLRQGEYEAARARFEASLTLCRGLGNREGIANALEELATVFDEQGVDGQQESLLDESLALYRELGDRSGIAAVLGHLGMEAWARGEHERAISLLSEALALYREVGDRRGVARLLGNQSVVALSQRDHTRSAECCRTSLALYQEAGDTWAIGRYLPVLAAAVHGLGQHELAARLFAAATALRGRLDASLPPIVRPAHDRAIAGLRAVLGEAAFASAWAEGAAMSPEDVV